MSLIYFINKLNENYNLLIKVISYRHLHLSINTNYDILYSNRIRYFNRIKYDLLLN